MSTLTACPIIHFPEDYDARSEHETPSRGYLSEVVVELEDGSRYLVFFIDLIRLGQTLADDVKDGRPYFSEPGLVVLPAVTTECIKKAVHALWLEGYFQHLKPVQR